MFRALENVLRYPLLKEHVMNDPHNLQRFVDAQQPVFEAVRAELRAGRKRSHWMWFVFPQIKGLGHSEMAQKFAIGSIDEARAYLAHPLLGPRLQECTKLLLLVMAPSINVILGYPDDLKFHSSMTLFAQAADDPTPFNACLERYFGGKPDQATLNLL